MLFVGDDWAEDHHDIELVDDEGAVLVRRRLPEGIEAISALHALIAAYLPEEWADLETGRAQSMVKVGIETDRGPWSRRWSSPVTRCSRSTRCRWPATGNGTPLPGRSPTPPLEGCLKCPLVGQIRLRETQPARGGVTRPEPGRLALGRTCGVGA